MGLELKGTSVTYRGVWAPTTNYAEQDVVTYGGTAWIAPIAFTSGASFSAANWEPFALGGSSRLGVARKADADVVAVNPNSVWVDIVSGTFDIPDTSDVLITGDGPHYNLTGTTTVVTAQFRIIDVTASNAVVRQKLRSITLGQIGESPFLSRQYTPPAAGSRTFKAQMMSSSNATTMTLFTLTSAPYELTLYRT